NTAVLLHENSANFEMGHIKETGNKFDFAIQQDNAFFAVDTPWGIRYTKDGAFTINNNGELVTAEGYKVMSRNAQGTANIVVDQNARFEVDKTGTIYANGIAGDQLMIVEFDDVRQLQKVGRNQFAAVDIEPTDADNAGVKQGYIEEANVDPIAEMVRMIEASRGYEMYAKVVQTHDEISQKAASQILTQ
ncbi:MAG: flagellar hook-basal body protein, partial [Mucispirillum sp.]|nr:flagellar hook-basal body protein [Mucispirillum sp.]